MGILSSFRGVGSQELALIKSSLSRLAPAEK
ncbi:hypothetical protein CMALT394_220021 [Carnobacterium maltaromaticum]|nr:hypothetical protein CMALT394_220021 [Carnobacterium maltaromaticum]